MPRKGENIYKRKDGRWEGRYRKQCQKKGGWGYVYGRSYRECREKLLSAKSEQPLPAPACQMSLDQLLARWLELQAEKGVIRSSTYFHYRFLIEKHIGPCLGSLPLAALSREKLQEFVMEKRNAGRLDGKGGLSFSTVSNILTVLSAALRSDLAQSVLPVNPAQQFRIGRGDAGRRRTNAFSLEEQRLLEEALQKRLHGDCLSLGILLSLYTGLRVGELAALQWRDLSFAARTLQVDRTLQRLKGEAEGRRTSLSVGPPKSAHSIRTIPLSAGTCGLLQEYYESLPPESKQRDCFVFTRKKRPIEPRLWEYHFEKLLKSLSPGLRVLNFHALRHTFATRAIEAEMDNKSLSEILGHSSVDTTMRIYVHSFLSQKRRGMDQLEQYMSAVKKS